VSGEHAHNCGTLPCSLMRWARSLSMMLFIYCFEYDHNGVGQIMIVMRMFPAYGGCAHACGVHNHNFGGVLPIMVSTMINCTGHVIDCGVHAHDGGEMLIHAAGMTTIVKSAFIIKTSILTHTHSCCGYVHIHERCL
jgi:hypothetical protein